MIAGFPAVSAVNPFEDYILGIEICNRVFRGLRCLCDNKRLAATRYGSPVLPVSQRTHPFESLGEGTFRMFSSLAAIYLNVCLLCGHGRFVLWENVLDQHSFALHFSLDIGENSRISHGIEELRIQRSNPVSVGIGEATEEETPNSPAVRFRVDLLVLDILDVCVYHPVLGAEPGNEVAPLGHALELKLTLA